ncbi:hypothetical protein AGDE_05888 [Angomonas deanei]|nr:hypothetical protein AGDE_05888 [Angomonas deanei]|eukprot:EPY38044.1 hypothetical protein AGDE_05888 [Angomonas deanei]
MSLFGGRETVDESFTTDASQISPTTSGENNCQRFWSRLMSCVRESQEMDVLYDCRSRMIDMRECMNRNKQATWALRETMATLRKSTSSVRGFAPTTRRWVTRPSRGGVHVRRRLDKEVYRRAQPTVFEGP